MKNLEAIPKVSISARAVGIVSGGGTALVTAAYASSIPGIENCSAWTSNSKFLTGTHAYLQHNWGDTPTAVAPWVGASGGCDLSKCVWCVED